ncbi:MAG: AAA family ATPase [Phaeodactylibacter sp.]|nr:AAA family ATPase [Phaeodactylibacter sp.]
MYIDSINIKQFRTFRESENSFIHKDQDFEKLGIPKPKLPNINLVLGINGLGKTTLLKAVALAALGPAVQDSGIFPYRLIRREPVGSGRQTVDEATICARFKPHEQDRVKNFSVVESQVKVKRKGDLETLRWDHTQEKLWHPIFSSTSDAFFFVGYGANRRVEKREREDLGSRKASAFARAQRIHSLFEEAYSLIPLNAWLPHYENSNPSRYKQVVNLINQLLGKGHYEFKGEMENREYLFEQQGLKVPFPALSDGYRAFLGWVSDLLYHVCETCPSGKKLVNNKGIVMVDEIDLHLHPNWQMNVLPVISKALPNIQFIVTTHSPLIVGSLEWMNIIVMTKSQHQASTAKHLKLAVHGLDADQVLLTDYFGLKTTRASKKARQIKDLSLKAREGDSEAAKQLLEKMMQGEEEFQ